MAVLTGADQEASRILLTRSDQASEFDTVELTDLDVGLWRHIIGIQLFDSAGELMEKGKAGKGKLKLSVRTVHTGLWEFIKDLKVEDPRTFEFNGYLTGIRIEPDIDDAKFATWQAIITSSIL